MLSALDRSSSSSSRASFSDRSSSGSSSGVYFPLPSHPSSSASTRSASSSSGRPLLPSFPAFTTQTAFIATLDGYTSPYSGQYTHPPYYDSARPQLPVVGESEESSHSSLDTREEDSHSPSAQTYPKRHREGDRRVRRGSKKPVIRLPPGSIPPQQSAVFAIGEVGTPKSDTNVNDISVAPPARSSGTQTASSSPGPTFAEKYVREFPLRRASTAPAQAPPPIIVIEEIRDDDIEMPSFMHSRIEKAREALAATHPEQAAPPATPDAVPAPHPDAFPSTIASDVCPSTTQPDACPSTIASDAFSPTTASDTVSLTEAPATSALPTIAISTANPAFPITSSGSDHSAVNKQAPPSRRKRVVRKGRYFTARKPVLSLLLGRELAAQVRPLLRDAARSAPPAQQTGGQVDGAEDGGSLTDHLKSRMENFIKRAGKYTGASKAETDNLKSEANKQKDDAARATSAKSDRARNEVEGQKDLAKASNQNMGKDPKRERSKQKADANVAAKDERRKIKLARAQEKEATKVARQGYKDLKKGKRRLMRRAASEERRKKLTGRVTNNNATRDPYGAMGL